MGVLWTNQQYLRTNKNVLGRFSDLSGRIDFSKFRCIHLFINNLTIFNFYSMSMSLISTKRERERGRERERERGVK